MLADLGDELFEAIPLDAAFAEEARKVVGFVPEYVASPETNRQVRSALAVKPEIRAFVANYIKSANK